MLLKLSSALFLRLSRMRLCLTRHTINRERLLCKGRDEIVLLSPHRHAGFRAGKKPVSSKVHNAVTFRHTARFYLNFMFQLFSSIRQNRSHPNHKIEIHSFAIDYGEMIATRTMMRSAPMCRCTQASGYNQSTNHAIHQHRI